ncbi:helix-turn-helix transcriptional regulator [Streptococcus merionis]|uniref:Transcriptional regulator n=1 Tax=Streptococcus merionis TaxID=400065 RepID=A0A239SLF5_9STRE|nr:helix-turn-helix transcriptional regulator [Streptococcus merionis]SNU86265.1 transcriptional regulator [Streptococcus merionis]
MKLGYNIQKHRQQLNLSQEELAEQIFVSRQTISNWENGKNTPDIQSLLLLSKLFQISIENLVDGDVQTMQILINQKEQEEFERDSKIMTLLMFLLPILSFPIFYFLEWWGVAIFVVLWGTCLYYANRVEKVKKAYDSQTYKELVALSLGQPLSEIEKIEEKAKYPYQKAWIVVAFVVFSAILSTLIVWLTLALFS